MPLLWCTKSPPGAGQRPTFGALRPHALPFPATLTSAEGGRMHSKGHQTVSPLFARNPVHVGFPQAYPCTSAAALGSVLLYGYRG